MSFVQAFTFVNMELIPWNNVECGGGVDYYTKMIVSLLCLFGFRSISARFPYLLRASVAVCAALVVPLACAVFASLLTVCWVLCLLRRRRP